MTALEKINKIVYNSLIYAISNKNWFLPDRDLNNFLVKNEK
jgi:hypothetical protein